MDRVAGELTRRYSAYAREHGVDLGGIIAREIAAGRKAMREHSERLLFGGFYRKVLSAAELAEVKRKGAAIVGRLSERDKEILAEPGRAEQKIRKCVRMAMGYFLEPCPAATTPVQANAIVTRAVARFNTLRSAWGQSLRPSRGKPPARYNERWQS